MAQALIQHQLRKRADAHARQQRVSDKVPQRTQHQGGNGVVVFDVETTRLKPS